MTIFKKINVKLNPFYIPEFPFCHEYLKVFSHPRSGTHFSEAFIGNNFYKNIDLSGKNVEWGHWSNRKINVNGNQFQKLFGSHMFPNSSIKRINYPSIYIYRDGRAVAYSIWKTGNFLNPSLEGISLSDFLRIKLDWLGTPGRRSDQSFNIAEHWERHVLGWMNFSKGNKNILIIKYEDLIFNPYEVYKELHSRFFATKDLLNLEDLDLVKGAVGLKPNKAVFDAWRTDCKDSDMDFFKSNIKTLELPLI